MLDPRDQWHGSCVPWWPELVGRCVTTDAVLTEACHFARRLGGRASLPLEFVLAADIPVVTLDERMRRRAALLMDKYSDPSMDYADATLVTVAEVLDLTRVFTTDRRGFGSYAAARGHPFDLLPTI